MKWLLKFWRARQRAIDLDILWPECLRQAKEWEQADVPALDLAKAAFMTHCANDPAWTKDYDEASLVAYVDRLE
jgi:hypothetical protein